MFAPRVRNPACWRQHGWRHNGPWPHNSTGSQDMNPALAAKQRLVEGNRRFLEQQAEAGSLLIVGAEYSPQTGVVEFLWGES